MSNVTTIGIDLAKTVFQIWGLNQARKIVFNRQVSRAKLIGELQKHPKVLLAMEACGSSIQVYKVKTDLIPASIPVLLS